MDKKLKEQALELIKALIEEGVNTNDAAYFVSADIIKNEIVKLMNKDEIKKRLSRRIADNNLEPLRVEEEILIPFIINQNVSMAASTDAIVRARLTDKEQIEILGGL